MKWDLIEIASTTTACQQLATPILSYRTSLISPYQDTSGAGAFRKITYNNNIF
jgi:hypothetical protein